MKITLSENAREAIYKIELPDGGLLTETQLRELCKKIDDIITPRSWPDTPRSWPDITYAEPIQPIQCKGGILDGPSVTKTS